MGIGGYKGDKFSVFISRPKHIKKTIDWNTSKDGKGYDVFLHGKFHSYYETFPEVEGTIKRLKEQLKRSKNE